VTRLKNNKINDLAFTLIEVLLGLSIFFIVSVTAYSVFSAGIRLNRKVERQEQLLRETRWALELLSKEIENMVFYDFSNSYEDKTSLMGSKDKISFIMPTQNGLRVVKYYLVSLESDSIHKVLKGKTHSKNVSILLKNEIGAKKEALIREDISFVDDINRKTDSSKIEILAMNIKKGGLRFYYGYLKSVLDKEIVWEQSWNNNYISSMIRIEIDLFVPEQDEQKLTLIKDVFIPTGTMHPIAIE